MTVNKVHNMVDFNQTGHFFPEFSRYDVGADDYFNVQDHLILYVCMSHGEETYKIFFFKKKREYFFWFVPCWIY